MKKQILLLCFLVVAVFHNAIGQKKVDWEVEKNDLYYLEYPKDWTLDKSGNMGTSFFLFSPLASAEDEFRENINLIVQDLKGLNIDLEKFTEISVEQVKTLVTDSKIEVNERLEKNNLTFHKLIYSGRQGLLELYFEQYYWVIDEKAYVLTFTCKNDTFSDYQEVGEAILNSFKLVE